MSVKHGTMVVLTAGLGWTVIGLGVGGCSQVEGTGRSQFMLISQDQESELGLQAYEEILSKEQRSSDERMTAIVVRVGQRIAAVANRPDFEWEFNLIESPQMNAFCLPGGKIAVYTGILPVMQNEAGMAAVMGHEVAHAVARHGGERVSQNLGAKALETMLSYGLKGADAKTQEVAMGVFGAGAKYGILLPYSRTHELEADQLGLMYAAEAGYDPRESVALWQRMQAANEGRPPEFASTHPHEERRIKMLQGDMPQAMTAYEQAPVKTGTGESW